MNKGTSAYTFECFGRSVPIPKTTLSKLAKREPKRVREAKEPKHSAGVTYEVYVPPPSVYRGQP